MADAGSSRKRARKLALSDSDEELSSEDESDMDYEEEEPAPAPKRGSKPRPRKADALTRGEDDSGDEAVAFTEADLVEDEADAARLAQMTELEREFELAERAERRQQEVQRRKLLKQTGKAAQEAAHGPVPAGPTVAGTRSRGETLAGEGAGRSMRSGREEREEAAKKTAMQELVAARKARTEGRGPAADEEAERDESLSRSPSPRRARLPSDDEDEALSDLEEDGAAGGWKPRQEDEEEEDEAAFEDVCSVIVPRYKLEKWLGEPFFAATMPGCMVRVSLGTRTCSDGIARPHYMLAQVVDVEERAPGVYKDSGQPWRSPYPFGPNQEKTSTWLRVARGFSERGMPLALVSNSAVSEAEFEAWQRACSADRRPQLGRTEVAEVARRIKDAETYTYTAADVAAVLERKRAKGEGARNAALERARLERERDAAAEAGDVVRHADLEKELKELEERIEVASARRGLGVGMEDINKKNRNINFQNALNNVSNKVLEGPGGATKAEGSKTLDPFSRRVTRPQNYWSTKGEEAGTAAEAASEPAPAPKEPATPAPAASPAPALQHVVDLSSLDLSLLERPPALHPLARRLLGAAVARQVSSANAELAARPGVQPLHGAA
ncbi:hypothetical protein ACKKBF_B04830 [Auxenochlorella protothecoides x Auxenochlorella symbiontica]